MPAAMEPIRHSVPRVLADLLRDAPLSPGKVDFAWKTTVGAAVARATQVRLEDGVLLVEASSKQWAREVMRSSPVILRRLQFLLGDTAVTRISLRKND